MSLTGIKRGGNQEREEKKCEGLCENEGEGEEKKRKKWGRDGGKRENERGTEKERKTNTQAEREQIERTRQ